MAAGRYANPNPNPDAHEHTDINADGRSDKDADAGITIKEVRYEIFIVFHYWLVCSGILFRSDIYPYYDTYEHADKDADDYAYCNEYANDHFYSDDNSISRFQSYV